VSPAALLLASVLVVPPPQLPLASGLRAAAAASGRPRECQSGSRRALSQGPSVWERARVPTLQKYCDSLSRARAQLSSNPELSKKAAQEADAALPGKAAPKVALARAALALGDLEAAAKEFLAAKKIDPRSVEDPSTMHDLARVLRKTGKRDEALTVYRALVPRVDLLSSTELRVSVLLEAAHASMAAHAADPEKEKEKSDRPAAKTDSKVADLKASPLDEAIAYLREAKQRPPTMLANDVALALVLALDRAGEREAADAALADAHRTGARVRKSSLDYLSSADEKLALEALVLEGSDRAAATKSWEAYLATPAGKGAWGTAARARLDALKRGGGKVKKVAPAAPPGKK
jgi:tetratricopeptide (TPR) repeat protein